MSSPGMPDPTYFPFLATSADALVPCHWSWTCAVHVEWENTQSQTVCVKRKVFHDCELMHRPFQTTCDIYHSYWPEHYRCHENSLAASFSYLLMSDVCRPWAPGSRLSSFTCSLSRWTSGMPGQNHPSNSLLHGKCVAIDSRSNLWYSALKRAPIYEKSLYVKSTIVSGEPTAQTKYISGFRKMLCLA